MGSIQAFRDIANSTSVSDSRYVYFANGKDSQGNVLEEKQTLCFNAEGKPREFKKPMGLERQQDWSAMRSRLCNLVAKQLGGTDSTAFKEIEKELFGKLVNGRYAPETAMKPLRKRDIVAVLTKMDLAVSLSKTRQALDAGRVEVPVAVDVQAPAKGVDNETLVAQMKLLKEVASSAYGKHEGKKGGNGYMGISAEGKVVKFLTHSSERKDFAGGEKTVRDDVREFVNSATDNLRNQLLEIAGSIDASLKGRVEAILKVETKPNGVTLLSRANVANAISEISKSFVGVNNAKFSWNDVKHARTCPDSTLAEVFRFETHAFPETIEVKKFDQYTVKKVDGGERIKITRMVPKGYTVVNKDPGGSTGAMILERDGFKFVFKQAEKADKEHVLNEVDADLAYRSAGIRVPDCRCYEVDGKIYKISKFVDGCVSFGDWWKEASVEDKAQVRKELLKGYPLDALFANWDVVGRRIKNNVLIQNNIPWRIDNGGALKCRAQGGLKDDKYGKQVWGERMFPDDWIALRNYNPEAFGDFTAHEIWHAASEIDFDDLVSKLPNHILTEPFLHCVSVMKDMAKTCQGLEAAGKTTEEISSALAAHYDELKASHV